MRFTNRGRRRLHQGLAGGGLLAAAVALAACGSSSSTGTASTSGSGSSSTSSSAGSGTSSTSSQSASSSTSSGAPTISTASVAGFGTVLVNEKGETLYLLTSEKGGKITCTDDNGCTNIWPDTELPSGVTAAKAGSGIQASLLGTTKDSKGSLYVTYNGWPLYTFRGDGGQAGQAKGEGITNFGGTWYVINASGNPVTSHS